MWHRNYRPGTATVPKVSSRLNFVPILQRINRLCFQCILNIEPVGIAKAKDGIVETKTINERTIMKLMRYERPGLAWPSFGRLTNLQDELDRLFESPLTGWAPALDVQEDKDKFTIRAELPGLKREDIDVSLQDGALVISGERKTETIKEDTEVHRQERFYGKFSRALTLPTAVSGDQVKAAYKDGILTVTLPKAEEAKPKHVTVSE